MLHQLHSLYTQPQSNQPQQQQQEQQPPEQPLQPLQDVELLYHQLPLPEDAALEARVEAAFRAAAASLGLRCSVQRTWGVTLFHPEDLPYQQYAAAAATAAAAAATKQQRQQRQAQERGPKQEWEAGQQGASSSIAGLSTGLQHLPGVMTQFRKLTQQHARVRPPLPPPSSLPPLPPGFSAGAAGAGESTASSSGSGSSASTSSASSLLGSIPSDVHGLYALAGAGDALARLQALVATDLAAALAAAPDPRSAFPFAVSEEAALERLRYYLWGRPQGGMSGGGGAGGAPAEQPPALTYFSDTRWVAGRAQAQEAAVTGVVAFGGCRNVCVRAWRLSGAAARCCWRPAVGWVRLTAAFSGRPTRRAWPYLLWGATCQAGSVMWS